MELLNRYREMLRLRQEGKLPHPGDYYSKDESEVIKGMWDYASQKLPAPQRLIDFIIKNGGIRDLGGDIVSLLGKANMRPGLINNKNGMHPDAMTRHAWESGFLDDLDRPQINQLF